MVNKCLLCWLNRLTHSFSVWPVNNCCGCMHQHFSLFGLQTCSHWVPTLHTTKYPSSCKYQTNACPIICTCNILSNRGENHVFVSWPLLSSSRAIHQRPSLLKTTFQVVFHLCFNFLTPEGLTGQGRSLTMACDNNLFSATSRGRWSSTRIRLHTVDLSMVVK